MAVPEALGGLRDRWASCRAQDDQKAALVADLFKLIEVQSRELEKSESVLNQALKEKKELKQKQNAHNYILVVIDGDCMPFLDEFVRQGMVGGRKAAQALKDAVKGQWPSHTRRDIVTRIYANMKGMGTTYENNGVVSDLSDWYSFVSGFNMVDPLFDYLDAGNGKECADYKIKTIFQHHFDNVHCQRIVLGASADNGYARLLGEYAEDRSSRDRITLLEGPSFARELKEISDKFETCSFPGVFERRKVTSGPPSRGPSRARSRSRMSRPTTPEFGLKSALKSPRAEPAIIASPILRNRNGERVDSPLKVSREAYQEVKAMKLCNTFYLLGVCGAKGQCRHDHDKALTDEQRDALRSIVRGSACDKGLKCDDQNCIAGHCCRYSNCTRRDCWFPPEMHGVDTRVAPI